MGSDTGYAIASVLQCRDRLENGRSTDDKMLRGIWKEMENRKTNKVRMTKVESKMKERRF